MHKEREPEQNKEKKQYREPTEGWGISRSH